MSYPYPPEFPEWRRERQIAYLVQISRRADLLAALRGGLEHPIGSQSRRLAVQELAELLLVLDWHHDLEPGAWEDRVDDLESSDIDPDPDDQ